MTTEANVLKSLVDNVRTDKNTVHYYLDTYEQLFKPMRETAKNVLEIGVRDGGSMKLWHDYFPNATIYGIDNMENMYSGVWPEIIKPRIKLLMPFNAYDTNLIHTFKSSGTQFDMLLDDGPHTLESMLFFAEHYTPLLTQTGVLIIEDVQEFDWIPKIVAAFPERFRSFVQVVDLRPVHGRYDDLLVILDMNKVPQA